MLAVPPSRVETKATIRPSGDNSPWASNAGLSVNRSSPEPSGRTRKISADPNRSEVNTIHPPPRDNDGMYLDPEPGSNARSVRPSASDIYNPKLRSKWDHAIFCREAAA